MPNCYHIDQPCIVKDLVYDPVFSNADSPEIPRPTQLATARRPRVPGQGLDRWEDPGYEARIEGLELFASGAGKTDNVFTHSVSICRFAAAAAGHQLDFRAAHELENTPVRSRRHPPKALRSCASRGRQLFSCHSYQPGISLRAYLPLNTLTQGTNVDGRNLTTATARADDL